MAHPPVPSVVVRTQKPTPAQRAQRATQQKPAAASFGSFGGVPMVAPPKRAAAPSPTQPPRVIVGRDSFGVPIYGPAPDDAGTAVLNVGGAVGALKAKPQQKPVAKPPVRVTVHPNGKIEVHQAAPAASSPTPTAPAAKPATTVAGALGHAPKGGRYQTDAQGRTDTTLNVRPGATPAAVAPQLSLNDQAQNILDPVKQSILDAINQRVNAQQSAITGYAKDLAGMMGKYAPEAGAVYGNAETGQAAIDAALAQTLSGAGASGQTDLAGRLAAIDADPGTAARINGAAGATTQGALGAAAGRGAASLSQLVGEKANAQDYGAKLPGLAGLYGLSATKSAQSQGTTDTANAVAQLEQKLPDVVQQLKTDATQNKQLRFEHGVALLQANGNVVTPQIRSLLGGTLPTGLTAKGKSDAAKVKIEQQNADTSAENARVNAAYKQAQLGITETKLKASIMKEHATAKAKGQHLGLSAKDWENYNSLALAGARSAHNGTPDGTHPPISWQQFLTIGMGEKIPIGILISQGKRVYSQAEIRQGLIPGRK